MPDPDKADLANAILSYQYIPGRKVSVDERLDFQIHHPISNMSGAAEQSWGQLTVKVTAKMPILREKMKYNEILSLQQP